MSSIIFTKSGTHRDSYTDYYRLIELSGFPLIPVSEIDPDSDHTYIYSPSDGDTRPGWPGAKARIIHWQLEWCTHPNDQHPTDPGVSEVWSMDAWQSRNIGARYVPIGSHPDLVHEPLNGPCPIEYDAALLSYMSYRRQWLANEMLNKGMRLAPNAWGAERHHILTHSKAMIHIHQHDGIPGVAALRLALAAAYKLPVITETCADYGIFSQGDLLRADYGYLADFAHMWVCRNDTHMLEDYGHSLHQKLCVEQTFRKCIEAAL